MECCLPRHWENVKSGGHLVRPHSPAFLKACAASVGECQSQSRQHCTDAASVCFSLDFTVVSENSKPECRKEREWKGIKWFFFDGILPYLVQSSSKCLI